MQKAEITLTFDEDKLEALTFYLAKEKTTPQKDLLNLLDVYMYLKDRSNKDGICWPGIETIARELKLSRSTVKRAMDDLVLRGYLTKEARKRPNGGCTSNLYRLILR